MPKCLPIENKVSINQSINQSLYIYVNKICHMIFFSFKFSCNQICVFFLDKQRESEREKARERGRERERLID